MVHALTKEFLPNPNDVIERHFTVPRIKFRLNRDASEYRNKVESLAREEWFGLSVKLIVGKRKACNATMMNRIFRINSFLHFKNASFGSGDVLIRFTDRGNYL